MQNHAVLRFLYDYAWYSTSLPLVQTRSTFLVKNIYHLNLYQIIQGYELPEKEKF